MRYSVEFTLKNGKKAEYEIFDSVIVPKVIPDSFETDEFHFISRFLNSEIPALRSTEIENVEVKKLEEVEP